MDKNELQIGEGGRRARRRPFLIGLPLFAVALLTTCGIESVPYYYPPSTQTATINSTSITFTHYTLNNGSDFKGYELYYRCYADWYKAEADRTAIEILANSTTSAPDSVLYTMVNTYKFTRMYNNNNSAGSTPVFTFPNSNYDTSSVSYFVQIPPASSATQEWNATVTFGADPTNPRTIVLYRSALNTFDNSHKYFVTPPSSPLNDADFATSDGDYDDSIYGSAENVASGNITGHQGGNLWSAPVSLYIVIFALGLGLPQDNLNFVPSMPASFYASIQIRP